MTKLELIKALSRLKVETGSLACLGCGYERNCSTQGCRILREAEMLIANVAPVRHGYWRKVVGTRYCGISKDGNPIYRESYSYCCSNCDRGTIIKERYCPRCGAKMDGGNCDD